MDYGSFNTGDIIRLKYTDEHMLILETTYSDRTGLAIQHYAESMKTGERLVVTHYDFDNFVLVA
jgi:hypothetical protein